VAEYAYSLIVDEFLWREFIPQPFPYGFAEFRVPFLEYVDEYGVSNRTVLLGAYYAVAVLQGCDVGRIRYVLVYLHSVVGTLALRKDFRRFKCIVTVRDPRANAWSIKKGGNQPFFLTVQEPELLMGVFDRIMSEGDLLYVRHEDLHLDYEATRQRICDFLGIDDDESLSRATVLGEEWDGTIKNGTLSITKKKSSRPSPLFVRDDWKVKLSGREIWWLERVFSRKIMKRFGYEPYRKVDRSYERVVVDDAQLLTWVLCFLRSAKRTEKVVGVYRHLPRFIRGILKPGILAMMVLINQQWYVRFYVVSWWRSTDI
jgi:hypothetical protein